MLEFWEGEKIWHEISQTFVTVRMALISVMCEIPAARKVYGFAGHSDVHGCSKYLKKKFKQGYFIISWITLDMIKTHVNSELIMFLKSILSNT